MNSLNRTNAVKKKVVVKYTTFALLTCACIFLIMMLAKNYLFTDIPVDNNSSVVTPSAKSIYNSVSDTEKYLNEDYELKVNNLTTISNWEAHLTSMYLILTTELSHTLAIMENQANMENFVDVNGLRKDENYKVDTQNSIEKSNLLVQGIHLSENAPTEYENYYAEIYNIVLLYNDVAKNLLFPTDVVTFNKDKELLTKLHSDMLLLNTPNFNEN